MATATRKFFDEPAWDALCTWLEGRGSGDIGPEAKQYAADAVVLLSAPTDEDELSGMLAEAFEAGRIYERAVAATKAAT